MKYAVCNELFGSLKLDNAAGMLRRAGYSGIEFAPYTVFGDFSAAAIRAGVAEIGHALKGEGLAFVGFHWLMVGPEPLHLTTPDEALRRRSLDHLRRLLDAAAELGGGVLVLGSPRQRSSLPGRDRATATAALAEDLSLLAGHAQACQSTILLEALSSDQTDVVNTLAEARALVEGIDSPGVGGMFDFHNVGDEMDTWETLIRKQGDFIAHVHINEMDGRNPGSGKSDYGPAFDALRAICYSEWVSMEVFDQPADPNATIREAMELFIRHDSDLAAAAVSR